MITALIPLVLFVGIFAGVMLNSVWRSWDKVERDLVRSEPLVGPVRHDAIVVAATLEHAGFIPSPRSWQFASGFGWSFLNLVRPDGTTAEIVSGARLPNFVLVTRLTDGHRLLSSTTGFLPVTPDVLRQTFPGADIGELLRQHDSSLAVLRRDVSTVPVRPDDVDHLVISAELEAIAYARQRRIVNAVGVVWRQLTRSHLDVGPVTSRPGAANRSEAPGTTNP